MGYGGMAGVLLVGLRWHGLSLRRYSVGFPIAQAGAEGEHQAGADDEQGGVDLDGGLHTKMFRAEADEQGSDGLHPETNHGEQAEQPRPHF